MRPIEAPRPGSSLWPDVGGSCESHRRVSRARMLTARAATISTVTAAISDSIAHEQLRPVGQRHRVGGAERDRVRERDVEVVLQHRGPAGAASVGFSSWGNWKSGATGARASARATGPAAVDLPEDERERDHVHDEDDDGTREELPAGHVAAARESDPSTRPMPTRFATDEKAEQASRRALRRCSLLERRAGRGRAGRRGRGRGPAGRARARPTSRCAA